MTSCTYQNIAWVAIKFRIMTLHSEYWMYSGWARFGLRQAYNQGTCSLFDAQKRLELCMPWEGVNQSCSLGTLLHGTVWRKSTNTQDKPGHLWVSAGCELSSSHQTSGSCADVIHKPTSEKEDRKEILPREQCSQPTTGSHKARWDKSLCLLALSVPWSFHPRTSTQR